MNDTTPDPPEPREPPPEAQSQKTEPMPDLDNRVTGSAHDDVIGRAHSPLCAHPANATENPDLDFARQVEALVASRGGLNNITLGIAKHLGRNLGLSDECIKVTISHVRGQIKARNRISTPPLSKSTTEGRKKFRAGLLRFLRNHAHLSPLREAKIRDIGKNRFGLTNAEIDADLDRAFEKIGQPALRSTDAADTIAAQARAILRQNPTPNYQPDQFVSLMTNGAVLGLLPNDIKDILHSEIRQLTRKNSIRHLRNGAIAVTSFILLMTIAGAVILNPKENFWDYFDVFARIGSRNHPTTSSNAETEADPLGDRSRVNIEIPDLETQWESALQAVRNRFPEDRELWKQLDHPDAQQRADALNAVPLRIGRWTQTSENQEVILNFLAALRARDTSSAVDLQFHSQLDARLADGGKTTPNRGTEYHRAFFALAAETRAIQSLYANRLSRAQQLLDHLLEKFQDPPLTNAITLKDDFGKRIAAELCARFQGSLLKSQINRPLNAIAMHRSLIEGASVMVAPKDIDELRFGFFQALVHNTNASWENLESWVEEFLDQAGARTLMRITDLVEPMDKTEFQIGLTRILSQRAGWEPQVDDSIRKNLDKCREWFQDMDRVLPNGRADRRQEWSGVIARRISQAARTMPKEESAIVRQCATLSQASALLCALNHPDVGTARFDARRAAWSTLTAPPNDVTDITLRTSNDHSDAKSPGTPGWFLNQLRFEKKSEKRLSLIQSLAQFQPKDVGPADLRELAKTLLTTGKSAREQDKLFITLAAWFQNPDFLAALADVFGAPEANVRSDNTQRVMAILDRGSLTPEEAASSTNTDAKTIADILKVKARPSQNDAFWRDRARLRIIHELLIQSTATSDWAFQRMLEAYSDQAFCMGIPADVTGKLNAADAALRALIENDLKSRADDDPVRTETQRNLVMADALAGDHQLRRIVHYQRFWAEQLHARILAQKPKQTNTLTLRRTDFLKADARAGSLLRQWHLGERYLLLLWMLSRDLTVEVPFEFEDAKP